MYTAYYSCLTDIIDKDICCHLSKASSLPLVLSSVNSPASCPPRRMVLCLPYLTTFLFCKRFRCHTRVWTWVIGQPGIRGVKASCSFEKFRCQIHSFISYEGSKFRPLESLAVRSPTSIPYYILRHALQITAHGGTNLWNLDLCAGLYRTYRNLSDESITGPLAILQITAPIISHNTAP